MKVNLFLVDLTLNFILNFNIFCQKLKSKSIKMPLSLPFYTKFMMHLLKFVVVFKLHNKMVLIIAEKFKSFLTN